MGRIRAGTLIALGLLLTAGGFTVWAAVEQAAVRSTTLTAPEAERIRRTLEKLSANQERILTALEEIEAELGVVKVRVTR